MYQRITITIEARHDGRLRVSERAETVLFVDKEPTGETYDRLSVDEAVDVLDQLVSRATARTRSFFDLHGAG